MLANLTQVVGFQAANKANLGKMDHLGLLRRAIVEKLERSPDLRADAEQVDSEFHGSAGGRLSGRGKWRRRGHHGKLASGHMRHYPLCGAGLPACLGNIELS